MTVVTINGPIGVGGFEVGTLVADLLGADYVDRLVFAEAAKRIGSTVAVLSGKEQRVVRLKDRIAYFLQTMMERSAVSGVAGEPYFGPGIEGLPAEQYADLTKETVTAAQQLTDKQYIDVTSAVIMELASSNNVVVIGRGSNIILRDLATAIHVGLTAKVDRRIETFMRREHFNNVEAEKHVKEAEKARQAYFRKFFKVHPDDPSLYHLYLNMDRMKVKTAAEIVTHAAQDLQS